MAKCLISPNILWRVENYESTDKKLSPAVVLKGLEWKLKFFHFKKDYDEMIRLTLECLSSYGTSADCQFFAATVEVNHESPCIKNLIEDFGKLFNNGKSSDFVLKCGEKSFSVHKTVLSARSDFFEGMFRSNMKEANDGIGKIDDLESEILELVLRYMYTGEIPELSMKYLHEVYTAADRFAVESLQAKCHSLLIESFITGSEENSDEDTEEALKNKQTDICKTKPDKANEKQLLKELFMTREWRLFSKEFPRKSQELCKTLIQK